MMGDLFQREKADETRFPRKCEGGGKGSPFSHRLSVPSRWCPLGGEETGGCIWASRYLGIIKSAIPTEPRGHTHDQAVFRTQSFILLHSCSSASTVVVSRTRDYNCWPCCHPPVVVITNGNPKHRVALENRGNPDRGKFQEGKGEVVSSVRADAQQGSAAPRTTPRAASTQHSTVSVSSLSM
jgi:hypothetical protein